VHIPHGADFTSKRRGGRTTLKDARSHRTINFRCSHLWRQHPHPVRQYGLPDARNAIKHASAEADPASDLERRRSANYVSDCTFSNIYPSIHLHRHQWQCSPALALGIVSSTHRQSVRANIDLKFTADRSHRCFYRCIIAATQFSTGDRPHARAGASGRASERRRAIETHSLKPSCSLIRSTRADDQTARVETATDYLTHRLSTDLNEHTGIPRCMRAIDYSSQEEEAYSHGAR